MTIRAKMMTVPGEQFVIRRMAYAMIKKAFDENGIKFAFPTVQVAGETEAATAAVAQRALELTHPAAAELERLRPLLVRTTRCAMTPVAVLLTADLEGGRH